MRISEELIHRWTLTEIKPLREQGSRGVYGAESGAFGPAILKVDAGEQLKREREMLSRMGEVTCKVLNYEDGALLLERIVPGTTLREEPKLEVRMEIFADIWSNIYTPAEGGITYLDWLEKACKVPGLPANLQEMGKSALAICKDLFDKYPERMWLHGDLHHDNLLCREDGNYAVIDPKGVIGPRIMDLPRFLLNEPLENVQRAMEWLSQELRYPLMDICQTYYVEAVLANLWLWEDGLPLEEEILRFAEANRIICFSKKL